MGVTGLRPAGCRVAQIGAANLLCALVHTFSLFFQQRTHEQRAESGMVAVKLL